MDRPLTKADVDRLHNFSARLVPIKIYQEARKLQTEVFDKTGIVALERTVLQEQDTHIVQHAIEDVVKVHRAFKKSTQK
jgi:alanine racemase